MNDVEAKTIYLDAYTVSTYLVERIDLTFDLGEDFTLVTSSVVYQYNKKAKTTTRRLVLHGVDLELERISLDGKSLVAADYHVDDKGLSIDDTPDQFTLEIVTRVYPRRNTSLEGLYQSSGNFCTQCEAEGFRKITYYLDRPDVMAKFTTLIRADKEKYPVLLSNGNLIESGVLNHGRHFALWEDPFAKPAYLFALVAGDLEQVSEVYRTVSGRDVALEIYTEAHNIDKCDHAIQSLKRAMQWDEQRFGLEYDLDVYMIVAVDDFNMGAMENKGLNVFNSKLVFASPETATDHDYIAIEAVIGHEYFHNWTGNRVTCRDWFQLSLKEGLTVFRDQEFTADLHSRALKRIDDVRLLRTHQFVEDAGPMAHPIRPESFIEINNFYTLTVYEKGAEVVRLYRTLLGEDGFRKGMDLYFERHDGQAVTTEDFRAAMADANQVNLEQLKFWYQQAGTPVVKATMYYDAKAKTCTLAFIQSCPDTPEVEHKQPFLIPVAMGLLDRKGDDIPLILEGKGAVGTTCVLQITEEKQRFTFVNVKQQPLPSLLRGFSAPVKLIYPYTINELIFLMQHDSDAFNRWEASQRLGYVVLIDLVDQYLDMTIILEGRSISIDAKVFDAYQSILEDDDLDYALRAAALTFPSEKDITASIEKAHPDLIFEAHEFLLHSLGTALRPSFEACYTELQDQGEYSIDAESRGKRQLKNTCLKYLMATYDEDMDEVCYQQYQHANNMTDSLAAFGILMNRSCPQRAKAIDDFEQRWKHDTLVMDKWFTLQAGANVPSVLKHVKALMKHELFDIRNPNKVRALIATYANNNPVNFHNNNGDGYEFIASCVLALDRLNPQIAARLVRSLIDGDKYAAIYTTPMRRALERIHAEASLSSDVNEIVTKSLL